MEIQQLRIVVALAEAGSMTEAADQLAVTQPAISFAISSLEKEIGYRLFDRTRRGITVTAQGSVFLEKARSLLAIHRELQNPLKQRKDQGTLRVAGRQGFMQYVFPLLEKKLRTEAPEIRIESAVSAEHPIIIDALRVGKVDIAFGAQPQVKSIAAEVMYNDPVFLAVSKKHSLARKKKITNNDLAATPFCLPASSDRLRSTIDKFLRRLPQKPNVVLETNDYTLMKNLVRLGECIGFVYGHMLLLEREIVPVHTAGFRLTRDLTILTRQSEPQPHIAFARQLFIEETRRLLVNNERTLNI